MRATRRKAKPGEVLVFYGRLPGDEPDLIFCWGAGESMKRRSNIVHYSLTSKRPEIDRETMKIKFGPSFIEELEAAGFDTKTIQFSIRMKDDDK